METIKVNMNPNPLDVQTIHASQNDTEARQWEFELHNNGELIDTSDVKEQLVFKAYKGGTEQLLPENGSTPTTSPFLGDIRYPQGLLTDQEFTYRQSPTEEDGLAKITDIKGNTLVWNQLARNGNFVDTSSWIKNGANTVFTVSNNVANVEAVALWNGIYQGVNAVSGHKYLVIIETKNTSEILIGSNSLGGEKRLSASSSFVKTTYVAQATADYFNFVISSTVASANTINVKNFMLIDLTQMGLDISSPSDFTSLFPLSYYAYNEGSMLSFNGSGLKTIGFNQWDEEWEVGNINASTGQNEVVNTCIRSKNYMPLLPNTTYYFYGATGNGGNVKSRFYDANFNYLGSSPVFGPNNAFTPPSDARYYRFALQTAYGVAYKNDICINISGDRNGTYEPYKESSLSLPISQYFPTGMKSAGSVYDELTESKAITRIGAVDLGTLNWSQRVIGTTPIGMQTNGLSATIKNPSTNNDIANIISTAGTASSWTIAMGSDSSSGLMAVSGGYLFIATTETNPTAFKSAMSGVYLYYELATPTETPITTASLITENAEIPLSNEDGVLIGKCTEQLSENPGFIDAKIKLSDADGECYSNKIQLHVERKPS